MSYRLPPLNGLRAFEAAGRHLSFKRAAAELAVTPGAVSQQIRHLEAVLGVPLFRRLHKSLVLTPSGEALLAGAGAAFDTISEVCDRLGMALKSRPLRLGLSPLLTEDPERAVAEIAGTARPPGYVQVSATDDVGDLLSGRVDALLCLGRGPYPGMHTEVVELHPRLGPDARAMLVVWPGLVRCREFLKVRGLLTRDWAPG